MMEAVIKSLNPLNSDLLRRFLIEEIEKYKIARDQGLIEEAMLLEEYGKKDT